MKFREFFLGLFFAYLLSYIGLILFGMLYDDFIGIHNKIVCLSTALFVIFLSCLVGNKAGENVVRYMYPIS